MSFLHFNPNHVSIRKYAATTTGNKSVVKIEIEVNDHHELGFLLREIDRAKAEIAEAKKSAAKAKKPRQIENRPVLALSYLGGDS